jgi:hypothetical protein
MGISYSHAPEGRCQKVEPDLRAGFLTLWFARAQLRVGDNAPLLFCRMLSAVAISQSKQAISNSHTAPSAHSQALAGSEATRESQRQEGLRQTTPERRTNPRVALLRPLQH